MTQTRDKNEKQKIALTAGLIGGLIGAAGGVAARSMLTPENKKKMGEAGRKLLHSIESFTKTAQDETKELKEASDNLPKNLRE